MHVLLVSTGHHYAYNKHSIGLNWIKLCTLCVHVVVKCFECQDRGSVVDFIAQESLCCAVLTYNTVSWLYEK